MAKVRVHEFAKGLGMTSRKPLEVFKESGEFVGSASSTIEAPVMRKAHEYIKAHPELIEKKKRSIKKPASQAKAGKSGECAVDPDAGRTDGARSQSPPRVRTPEGRDAPGNGSTSVQASPTAERAAPRA